MAEEEKIETPQPKKRLLWRRIFLTFFLVFSFGIIVAYFYFTRASFLEKTISEVFAKTTNGQISLKVKKASLFRGFIFEDIEVFSSPEFSEKPLFRLDKFTLLYNVYGFWAGDFGIHEVGIYRPKIYLYQKNNRWNVESLLKPAKAKEEEKEKKEEKEPQEPKEISLPFSLRAFFKFILEDFSLEVHAEDPSNSQSFAFGLDKFTVNFYFLTKKISKLPKEPLGYLDLIDTFLVHLNPQEKVGIYFRNPQAASSFPLDLHLLLAFGKDRKNFLSSLKIGHEEIPLKYKGQHQLPLGLMVQYNMFYDPKRDFFQIEKFQIKVIKQLWLNIEGYIAKLTKPAEWEMDIRLNKSEINLNELYTYYQNFTKDKKLRFSGKVSLAPLAITGKEGKILVKGNLSLKNILAKLPDISVSVPKFALFYEAQANLQKKEGLPLEYAKAGWEGNLNKAHLEALFIYEPQKKVDTELFVKNLNVTPFAKGALNGIFNLSFTLKGPKETDLKARFSLNSPGFYYVVDKARSGINKLNFEIDSSLKSPTMAFKNIFVDVPKIYLALENRENRKAFLFDANTQVEKESKNIKVFFNLNELRLHLRNLQPTLTEKTQESLEGVLAIIRKSIVLRGNTEIKISGGKQNIEHRTNFIFEDFDIQDIWLRANVGIEKKLIRLSSSLEGLKNSLKMKIDGELKEGLVQKLDPEDPEKIVQEKGMAADIRFFLSLSRERMEKIFQDIAMGGLLALRGQFKDNIAKGEFQIKNFSIESPKFSIAQVNLDFPFEHNLLFLKPLNLTAANKERIIKNYHFAEKANFTISYVDIPHPTQEGKKFRLVYPQGDYPGLSAVMRYQDNVFQMPIMQIYTLNGLISLQDVIFNVGRARPKEMEYLLQLQIKDLDLKQLIPADKAKAIKDGAIRMDMLFYGNRLDQPIENLKGYISVYKIGEEFGKQALKVVKPDSGGAVDFVVDNSILVKKMDLDIKEGLIYARVIYQKKIFGQIISPKGDQILQERIPIPEFMQRAGREVQVYQQESLKKPEV